MSETIKTTRFDNGLTVLTEKMPDLRSATFGIWIKRGSRHEPRELNGITHFIEHAVFKGTPKRSALEIAIESDKFGGNLDAFTSHESTGFMMKVVDESVPQAFDLLADMVANPIFDEREMMREQRVIIEEMKMVEDLPEELLGEVFNAAFFPEDSLGLPIEGTTRTVKNFHHEITKSYHSQAFAPANIVIAAAGNVAHQQICDLAEKAFHGSTENRKPKTESRKPKAAAPILLKNKRDLEQTHLIIATPFVDAQSEKRYAATLLANVLGGGTSSRLWQSIRENRGLAYSVGSSAVLYQDCGVFSIYAGTSPNQFDEVVDLSIAEMRNVARETVSQDELDLVKSQAVAAILLGLESSSARAGALARQEIIHGRRIAPDEIINRLEAVTIEDLERV
ncbi:MAG: insulinase family protein, partial [Pyrinomonadaceae bacterium]|nr:insulinase family protein [Pyrinomonadaceae bacterium]